MGVGRVAARAAIETIRLATNRAQMRVQMGEAIELLQGWLIRRDLQDAEALPAFAESKQAQFNTFVAALPNVPVDQTP